MIYALSILFIPLYIVICYFIIAKVFYTPSTKELTQRDAEFWTEWNTMISKPHGFIKTILNYIFPYLPIIIMFLVAVTYYFWIYPRINSWGYGEQIIQLCLFVTVRYLCNNFFAKQMYKRIYGQGTSWSELGIIELFSSLDNQMLFILFIIPYSLLGVVRFSIVFNIIVGLDELRRIQQYLVFVQHLHADYFRNQ
jgi:hypothetical protein